MCECCNNYNGYRMVVTFIDGTERLMCIDCFKQLDLDTVRNYHNELSQELLDKLRNLCKLHEQHKKIGAR